MNDNSRIREMYGSTITEAERDEMMRKMAKDQADRRNRELRDMAGVAITRNEIKAMQRNSRKGKR